MAKSKFIKDFKEFAIKGNAVQLAVGVIIGSAFGKIVSSIVDDIIMPPLGWLIGGVDFTDLKIKLPQNPLTPDVQVTVNYGNFIQAAIVFLIVAFCVFLLVKGMAMLTRPGKDDNKPAAPAQPSKEELLLTEIRDLLRELRADRQARP